MSNIGAGGGGSGYIGNSSTFNKYMVGYNVATSSDESTLTKTTNKKSSAPMSGRPKMGNGFCRITYLSAIPETNTYIFLPDLTTDGRDTIRYDGTDIIVLDVSDELKQVVGGALATVASTCYTLDNGIISFVPEDDIYPQVTWAFDVTRNQAVIPPDSDITISCSFRADEAVDIYDELQISLYGGYATGEIDYGDSVRCCLLPSNAIYIDNHESGASYYGNFSGAWSMSDIVVNTWYKLDFVYHLSDGLIQNVKLYINDELKGTEDVSSSELTFFNIQGDNMPILTITVQDFGHNISIKDLSIRYTEG